MWHEMWFWYVFLLQKSNNVEKFTVELSKKLFRNPWESVGLDPSRLPVSWPQLSWDWRSRSKVKMGSVQPLVRAILHDNDVGTNGGILAF